MKNKPVVTCIIVKNNLGQILLIKRGREPFKGKWALISGIGEALKGFSPEQAVYEEVRCDLQTEIINPQFIFNFPVDDKKVKSISVFSGGVDDSKIKTNPPFSTSYQWISLKKALNLNLAFEHKQIIKKHIKTLK